MSESGKLRTRRPKSPKNSGREKDKLKSKKPMLPYSPLPDTAKLKLGAPPVQAEFEWKKRKAFKSRLLR